ncbi:MAG: hypothetical protein ACI379_06070 [Nocardioides sp.]|uniref:hypothetical protein n=1 Tax=Nocardioides sp. TaxID=35761 RepID=UPI003F0129A9
MSDASTSGVNPDDIFDGVGTYPVVLLVEQALSAKDAAQVRSLHEAITDQVVYHVLLPVEDAAGRIEASLGSLGAGDVMASPALALTEIDLAQVRAECQDDAEDQLGRSIDALVAAGGQAIGSTITLPPVEALVAKVRDIDAREAIVMTRPHVVAEFFHVDWTSRARRQLGVPVLHLVEAETFDEQAGSGEGVSGL